MSPLARSFMLLPLGVAIAFAAPAVAQQAAAADPDVNALVCQLGGCDAAAAEAAPDPTAAPAPGGPRVSATRGFTFKRVAPAPTGSTTVGTNTMATGAMATGTMAPARPAATPMAASAMPMPGRTPSADLRLDFASASAELDAQSRAHLAKLAAALTNPRLAGKRIRIEGHTDASGNANSNRLLSQRRAQAAADYLIAAGIPRGRIEVVGYGAAQPLPGLAATAPANRRVMATVLN